MPIQAESQENLVRKIQEIKDKANFSKLTTSDEIKTAGITFGQGNASHSRYAWTHYHDVISHPEGSIEIKVPTIRGRTIELGRYFLERAFNEGFIISETRERQIERESDTYKNLRREGFPTLESMQHLIEDKDGRYLVGDALLTRRLENVRNTIDLINSGDTQDSYRYVKDAVELLKRLHKEHDTIWGDPWLGNTFYKDGKMLLFDFGFKPNPTKTREFLQAKDLAGLTISAIYRTKRPQDAIVEMVMSTYNPDAPVRDSMRTSLESQLDSRDNMLKNIIEEIAYTKPVFGLTNIQVDKIREEILKII